MYFDVRYEQTNTFAIVLVLAGLLPVSDFPDASQADTRHLQEELRRLQSELDECRSLVTVAECEKENVVETEERKRKEEVASIQHIMEGRVARYLKQISPKGRFGTKYGNWFI